MELFTIAKAFQITLTNFHCAFDYSASVNPKDFTALWTQFNQNMDFAIYSRVAETEFDFDLQFSFVSDEPY